MLILRRFIQEKQQEKHIPYLLPSSFTNDKDKSNSINLIHHLVDLIEDTASEQTHQDAQLEAQFNLGGIFNRPSTLVSLSPSKRRKTGHEAERREPVFAP